MPTGKPVSQTGALRLGEAEQHAQGHRVSNSGAQIRRKTLKLRLLPLHTVASLPMYGDKVRRKPRNTQDTAVLRSRR